jgi:glycosyltransferase involved in cell wall biosynthesis
MNTPLVSVVVRTKDRPGLLREALGSIAKQSYPTREAVVVNDGGVDITDVIEHVRRAGLSITAIRHESSLGRTRAANRGLTGARGDWITFLDDDDVYTEEGLTTLMEEALRRPGDVVYGTVEHRFFLPDGRPDPSRPGQRFGRSFSRQLLLMQNYIPFNALCIPRDVAERAGELNESLDVFEDWEYLVRLSRHGAFHHVPETVALYRCFGESTLAGSRFSPEETARAEARLLASWWHEVTPEAVPVFRQHIVELTGHRIRTERAFTGGDDG